MSAHWASVKDSAFGAVGDGSTDDTAAIQAAIDAAPDHKCTLFFPRGAYLVTSPLVIPTVSGFPDQIKKIVFQGEGGDINGAAYGAFGEGGSKLVFDHPAGDGALIDAYSAFTGTETNQDPGWGGGVRDLALHNEAGSNYGIKANAVLGGEFDNIYVNAFSKPLWLLGEYYYAKFHHCRWRSGVLDFNAESSKSGGGPKGNGATFVENNFRDCLLRFGDTQWMGALLKFQNCWFESADEPPVVRLLKAGQVVFDGCYFEDQDGVVTNFIEYEGLSGNEGMLVVKNGRFRVTATGGAAILDVRGNTVKVVLENNELAVTNAGSVAVRENAGGGPSNLDIVSKANLTRDFSVPLFDGPTSSVRTLVAEADDCALDWSAVGARNAVKPDWTVL